MYNKAIYTNTALELRRFPHMVQGGTLVRDHQDQIEVLYFVEIK